MAKKAPMNAPKKSRVFETRDIDEVAKISKILYDSKIAFKITIKTYTPGEPVKFRFLADPMTDESREEIIVKIKS